jgi:hypothetical protein
VGVVAVVSTPRYWQHCIVPLCVRMCHQETKCNPRLTECIKTSACGLIMKLLTSDAFRARLAHVAGSLLARNMLSFHSACSCNMLIRSDMRANKIQSLYACTGVKLPSPTHLLG